MDSPLTRAKEEGERAYLASVPLSSNPYRRLGVVPAEEAVLLHEWAEGWLAAQSSEIIRRSEKLRKMLAGPAAK
jgi:hypothetical protein